MKKINVIGKLAARGAEAELRLNKDERTVTIVWSTGYEGLRHEGKQSFFERLDMSPDAVNLSRLNTGKAPFLLEHNQHASQQLGVIRKAWLEDGLGYAEVLLSSRPDVAGYTQDILDGVLSNISVGYSIEEFEEVGTRDGLPVLSAKRWTPIECSIVSVGFDYNATVIRSLEQQQTPLKEEEPTMTPEEIQKLKDEAIAEFLAAEEQKKKDEEAKAQAEAEEQERLKLEEENRKEEERCNTIALQVRALEIPDAETVIQEFITRKLTTEQVTKELITKLNKGEESPKGKTMDKKQQLEQAILNRVNARKFSCDKSNPYRGASLIDIAKELVERKSGESEVAFATRAIASTDLAELLGNVANKIVDQAPSESYAYPKITRQQQLRDFKATPAIAFSAAPLTTKSSETDDYQDATLTDSSENIQLKDLGRLFKISHVALMNDDVGVFTNLDREAEKMGARAVEKQLFDMLNANAALSDGYALFDTTNHGNNIAAGAAPSTTSLEAAELLMAAFKDTSGNPLDLKIKYLVVPPSLAMEAYQVANQIMATQSSNVNPWAGNIEVIVSSRINQVGGKDCWFAIADSPLVHGVMQGQGDKVEVAQEFDFNSKNLKLRVSMPSDVAPASYKGIVRTVLA